MGNGADGTTPTGGRKIKETKLSVDCFFEIRATHFTAINGYAFRNNIQFTPHVAFSN